MLFLRSGKEARRFLATEKRKRKVNPNLSNVLENSKTVKDILKAYGLIQKKHLPADDLMMIVFLPLHPPKWSIIKYVDGYISSDALCLLSAFEN